MCWMPYPCLLACWPVREGQLHHSMVRRVNLTQLRVRVINAVCGRPWRDDPCLSPLQDCVNFSLLSLLVLSSI